MNLISKPVKVILVDDSLVVLHILKKLLAQFSEVEVVGTYTNGLEALDAIPVLKPDVICTDYHMPAINGHELIMEIMEKNPKPILVISSSVQAKGDEETIFTLLEAGAVDVFPKPVIQIEEEFQKTATALVKKIVLLSGVHTFKRRRKSSPFGNTSETPGTTIAKPANSFKIVGIGASTGGPQVLAEIFQKVKVGFPFPIVCVQHISQGFIEGLVEWLDKASPLTVAFAENGAIPQPGYIYFPPEDTHLKFDRSGRFLVSKESPKNGHRPSVDVTFLSLAQIYGKSGLAILLTGMGADGAEGLLQVKTAGGFTVAQDEASCVVYGMPKVAAELGAAKLLLSPEEIVKLLNNFNS